MQVTSLDRSLPPGEGWGEGLPAMPNSSICIERGKDTAFVEKGTACVAARLLLALRR